MPTRPLDLAESQAQQIERLNQVQLSPGDTEAVLTEWGFERRTTEQLINDLKEFLNDHDAD